MLLLPNELDLFYVAAWVARTSPFFGDEAIGGDYVKCLAVMEMDSERRKADLISFRVHQNKSFCAGAACCAGAWLVTRGRHSKKPSAPLTGMGVSRSR